MPLTSINPSISARSLEGRTALVTGSTSGIGAAIASTLAAAGAGVLVSGRDKTRGQTVLTRIREEGGQARFLGVDLAADHGDLRQFAIEATDLLGGRIDILVNNAGIYPATTTADLTDGELDAMLAVNVRAPHVLASLILPAMAENGAGVVVNVGSWMASVGNPFAAMYTATKAAVEQLTRSWAAEFGPSGVRVNTISPGVTLTPGNEAARPILDAMTAVTPAGVVVQPEDIAQGVLFLASDASRMMHGSILAIDGGILSTRPA
ncbi:SDR family NAD(P)-dependent oxidoreductase [Arthrobacter sp. CAN_C5]|uniref:SDR family NAD(P)-dependent oxidoreductase n=1 Tax=Arthrobacter sp. CAN_C5 TaxID=2760706 RepID=UPI001AE4D0AB|nr:SDR family oxidoreductase [Arthrobacter sp. CAN_C5]MBP2217365.1 NAD(P)-dependent dehydrogenase (short-subunit alcohol dehydrogenase family) [Arthrobacter sp. CAN_C5]